MGNALTLNISNAEATADELNLSNNASRVELAFDKDTLAILNAKTNANLTHHEKKYIHRANLYYNTTYETF